MSWTHVRWTVAALAAILTWHTLSQDTWAGGFQPRAHCDCHQLKSRPDLFYNFWVPPCGCDGAGARLYVAPRPVPPVVGHTYITYQPLMPHEFLYKHRQTYLRYHPGSGVTKTRVVWR